MSESRVVTVLGRFYGGVAIRSECVLDNPMFVRGPILVREAFPLGGINTRIFSPLTLPRIKVYGFRLGSVVRR